MATISNHKRNVGVIFTSSQLRYAAAYVLITSAVLLFLNIYTPMTIRSMTFTANHTAMNYRAKMLVNALSSYKTAEGDTALSVIEAEGEQHTPRVVNAISSAIKSAGELSMTRVIVTDFSGRELYDSVAVNAAKERYALLPEIAEALGTNDVFYIRYDPQSHDITSKAAQPLTVSNTGKVIGAIYLSEVNRNQGALIAQLQNNILYVSFGLEGAVVLSALIFALAYSLRVRKLLHSVRQMHDGDYSARLEVRGRDELSRLGSAFNDLSVRLNQSESVRKQFVSDASHELKTPLASIKLLSDSILQNDMEQAMLREFVSDIGSEADRLTRLSEKLLELTRLDNRIQDTPELVSVRGVGDRVMRMLLPLANRQQIRLQLDCPEHCAVLSTEDDLYQILFNLTENAIKYNHPNGEVLLRAELRDAVVVISVADTGNGIPDDAKQHIFERFYRVDKARSRKAGGAGLGLSIVHDMVLRNHGSITVSDRPGSGSVFTVVFPAPDGKEAP